jgi:hypothetical protein
LLAVFDSAHPTATPIYGGGCLLTAAGQHLPLPALATYEGLIGGKIVYNVLSERFSVDLAPATVTRASSCDGQIFFRDEFGSVVAAHYPPHSTTPAVLETPTPVTDPQELASEYTYQTGGGSVPRNLNDAISGRSRSLSNMSSSYTTSSSCIFFFCFYRSLLRLHEHHDLVPPPNAPPVPSLPVFSDNPEPLPSGGSHSYQLIRGDIEDREADRHILHIGSNTFKCIAYVCTLHADRTTVDCQRGCTLKPCNETLRTNRIMARIHLRSHYQKEQRFYCTDW